MWEWPQEWCRTSLQEMKRVPRPRQINGEAISTNRTPLPINHLKVNVVVDDAIFNENVTLGGCNCPSSFITLTLSSLLLNYPWTQHFIRCMDRYMNLGASKWQKHHVLSMLPETDSHILQTITKCMSWLDPLQLLHYCSSVGVVIFNSTSLLNKLQILHVIRWFYISITIFYFLLLGYQIWT